MSDSYDFYYQERLDRGCGKGKVGQGGRCVQAKGNNNAGRNTAIATGATLGAAALGAGIALPLALRRKKKGGAIKKTSGGEVSPKGGSASRQFVHSREVGGDITIREQGGSMKNRQEEEAGAITRTTGSHGRSERSSRKTSQSSRKTSQSSRKTSQTSGSERSNKKTSSSMPKGKKDRLREKLEAVINAKASDKGIANEQAVAREKLRKLTKDALCWIIRTDAGTEDDLIISRRGDSYVYTHPINTVFDACYAIRRDAGCPKGQVMKNGSCVPKTGQSPSAGKIAGGIAAGAAGLGAIGAAGYFGGTRRGRRQVGRAVAAMGNATMHGGYKTYNAGAAMGGPLGGAAKGAGTGAGVVGKVVKNVGEKIQSMNRDPRIKSLGGAGSTGKKPVNKGGAITVHSTPVEQAKTRPVGRR